MAVVADPLLVAFLTAALPDVTVASTRRGVTVGDELTLPCVLVSGSGADLDSPWLTEVDAAVTIFAGPDSDGDWGTVNALAERVDRAFVEQTPTAVNGRSLTFLYRRQTPEKIPSDSTDVMGLAAIYVCSTQ